jgi:hypothetical protein
MGVWLRMRLENTVLQARFGTVPKVGRTHDHVGGTDVISQVFCLTGKSGWNVLTMNTAKIITDVSQTVRYLFTSNQELPGLLAVMQVPVINSSQ